MDHQRKGKHLKHLIVGTIKWGLRRTRTHGVRNSAMCYKGGPGSWNRARATLCSPPNLFPDLPFTLWFLGLTNRWITTTPPPAPSAMFAAQVPLLAGLQSLGRAERQDTAQHGGSHRTPAIHDIILNNAVWGTMKAGLSLAIWGPKFNVVGFVGLPEK